MKPQHPTHSSRGQELAHRRPRAAATPEELLDWYRERDRDAENLHRRYVRAKFGMAKWSDKDLARFHHYRRTVPRERAAQLVIARRYAVRGLTIAALGLLIAGLIHAAIAWWKRKRGDRVVVAAAAKKRPEVPS